MVESECYNVNPVATQGRLTLGPKDKIEHDRYAEEENKGWQNPESSFCVESAEVLTNRQRLHLEEAVSNEITGEREKYPKPNPAKKNVVIRINEVMSENQNQPYAAQAVEGPQMSLAGVDRPLLKRTHVFAQGTRNSTVRYDEDSCRLEQAFSLSNRRGARYIP